MRVWRRNEDRLLVGRIDPEHSIRVQERPLRDALRPGEWLLARHDGVRLLTRSGHSQHCALALPVVIPGSRNESNSQLRGLITGHIIVT